MLYTPLNRCELTISFGEDIPVKSDVSLNEYVETLEGVYDTVNTFKDYKPLLQSNHILNIEAFEANGSCFIREPDELMSCMRYYNKTNSKMFYKPIILKNKNGEVVPEPVIPNVTNVCAVCFYQDSLGHIYVAFTTHKEDATYGFPSYYTGPPGGKIDDHMTPLGTAITETYEEMGAQNIVAAGDIYEGYSIHNTTAYIFIRHKQLTILNGSTDPLTQQRYYTPFFVRVLVDEQGYLQKVEELLQHVNMNKWDDLFKNELKPYFKNVLVPRPLGTFDYESFGYGWCDLSKEAMVGNGYGRYNSWRKGFPVHLGLKYLTSIAPDA